MMDQRLIKQNRINTLLNRYFNLGVVILVVFLLLLTYLLVLRPKVDETALAIQDTISSQERLLQAEKNRLLKLQQAVESYDKVDAADLKRVNSILPNDYDKESLYGELEEIITRQGFAVTSIKISKEGDPGFVIASSTPVVSEKLGIIQAEVDIATINYAGLKNLLSILETNLKFLEVRDVKLMESNTATLELITYYYK